MILFESVWMRPFGFPATHEGVLTEDTVSSGNLAVTPSRVTAFTFCQTRTCCTDFPATVKRLNRNYPIPIDNSRAGEAFGLSGYLLSTITDPNLSQHRYRN